MPVDSNKNNSSCEFPLPLDELQLLSNRCSSIDALQEVGISAADLNKIKASGISTVLGVQQ